MVDTVGGPRRRRTTRRRRCRAFNAYGVAVTSDFALPGVDVGARIGDGPRLRISMASAAEIDRSWSGHAGLPDWVGVLGAGIAIRHQLGVAGDHHFAYGAARFYISPGATRVLCSAPGGSPADWRRQLLDTVLFSASFALGFELLHASAVECDGRVIAFAGATGAGKSTLAAELMRRGHRLFSDDVLAIRPDDHGMVCYPGPAVMNLARVGSPPEELGATVVAAFEDELWVTVDRVTTQPRRLAALYFLERNGASTGVSDVRGATALDVLPHAIALAHDSQRAQARFEAFSDLVDRVALRRLTRDATATPAALADIIEASLGSTVMAAA